MGTSNKCVFFQRVGGCCEPVKDVCESIPKRFAERALHK